MRSLDRLRIALREGLSQDREAREEALAAWKTLLKAIRQGKGYDSWGRGPKYILNRGVLPIGVLIYRADDKNVKTLGDGTRIRPTASFEFMFDPEDPHDMHDFSNRSHIRLNAFPPDGWPKPKQLAKILDTPQWRMIFVHEYVHYLDTKRTKAKNFISSGKYQGHKKRGEGPGHFDNPIEFNAYYQMAADIADKLAMDEPEWVTRVSFRDFARRIENTASSEYDKLSGQWRNKFHRRLYALYRDLQKAVRDGTLADKTKPKRSKTRKSL